MMNTFGKLNKSFSESELNRLSLEKFSFSESQPDMCFERIPVMKKTVLIVEEVYHNSPGVLKSGHSIPSQLNIESMHARTFDKFVNKNIKADTHEKCKSPKISSCYDNHDGVIPMDIDITDDNQKTEECSDVVENMDIDIMESYDNLTRTAGRNSLDTMVKKRQFKKELCPSSVVESRNSNLQTNPKLHEKNRLPCSLISVLIMLVFSLIFFFYFLHHDVIFVNSDIQLQNLQKDLLENVHEQKGPVNIIIRSLQHRNHWTSKIKVLSFIGSSGVGKTFVANILKKHFHKGLIHELYGIQLNFRSQWENVSSRIKSCCLNLIIIDDLNKKDTAELFAFVHSLPKDHYVLVVPIFNIQDSDDKLNYIINYDDINEIRHEFDNSNLYHELAVFHQFNDVQIKDWLEKQLKVQNMQYNEKLLNNVIYNHNALFEGLKGLYSKFLLELESLR